MSQAVFTPDYEAIIKGATNGITSKIGWTKKQYQSGGPFDKWLEEVKTCQSFAACCPEAGYANIIIRDFPTISFVSKVINKNFDVASGDESDCEDKEFKRLQKEAADEKEIERLQKQKEEKQAAKDREERIIKENKYAAERG